MDSLISLSRAATANGGSSNNFLYILLIIIPIGLVIFMFIKKKKGGGKGENKSNNKLKNKQEEDEVWLTIKRHLRETGEFGKEVIDSYVVKRPDPRLKTKETKLKNKELKELKKTDIVAYKNAKAIHKIQMHKKPKELYVVLFTTRNTKTLEVDDPRAIECEVIYKKINKNTNQRTILINQVLDYKKEMEWIQPIKAKDDKELARQLRIEQSKINRKKIQEEKIKQKKKEKEAKSKTNL